MVLSLSGFLATLNSQHAILQFTAYRYYRTVEPKREATFEYSFAPSETFSARPFGLTINLNYKDAVRFTQNIFHFFLVITFGH